MQAEASFAARHRCRRRVLEARAAADGGLLLGAANRSEWLTGWFVPAGIDDLPDQPLKGLYKTQVRQLAVALNVPAPVLRAAPSPDMMAGISDELALGMSYATIDVALDRLAGGLTGVQAGEAGLTVGELRRVRQLTQLSAWKRGPFSQEQLPQTDVAPFPVDGGPGGGFRMAARDS
jgi:NAD+ synthase